MQASVNKTEISIPCGNMSMAGDLRIPDAAVSMVLFSHGSGSNRFSTRNRYVADVLNHAGIATFLFDLLSAEEDKVYDNRFNIALLTKRLIMATEYMREYKLSKSFDMGYFGASTGAASALDASVHFPGLVNAVVSRGGRVDLCSHISEVSASTLLIAGELDEDVAELNRLAFNHLKCLRDIRLVKGATHLFEEPGALEQVASLAKEWFMRHLGKNPKKQAE